MTLQKKRIHSIKIEILICKRCLILRRCLSVIICLPLSIRDPHLLLTIQKCLTRSIWLPRSIINHHWLTMINICLSTSRYLLRIERDENFLTTIQQNICLQLLILGNMLRIIMLLHFIGVYESYKLNMNLWEIYCRETKIS